MPRGGVEQYKIFQGFRDRALEAFVVLGVLVVAFTETLSTFQALRAGALAVCWAAVVCFAIWRIWTRRTEWPRPHFVKDPVVYTWAGGIVLVLAITALTAACSPPNSTDAMAYHLPRVVYWAEQRSVRFFPTQYLNQIILQPMAEYLMLQSYLLSGGDRWINFGQWFASLGSIAGVSRVAGLLGATERGQAVAALFCATLPSGILASSGAKNDYVLALWMVCAVYFALRYRAAPGLRNALLLGAPVGLALLTKATAYLFLPWLVVAVLGLRPAGKRGLLAACACALAINAPQFSRNWQLSGSLLGADSAQGDGVYRWRNEAFGGKPTVSNLLRNVSEQLGARSERWNRGVYDFVAALHQRLDIPWNDPGSTWPFEVFHPPRNSNHEADAPNRWHLGILLIVFAWLLLHPRPPDRAFYTLALLAAFLSFCAYLKWQPFFARLLLPLFVLSSPLVGVVGGTSKWARIALCLFLVNNAKPALMENWVRPLKGPLSVLRRPRGEQYFADMTQWNNQASYLGAVDAVARAGCREVGLDTTNLHIEYPLQALLRERQPGTVFLHTGVQNSSARYAAPVAASPCAVVCLDCAGDAKRLALYGRFPHHIQIGRFVVFTKAGK